MALVGNKQRQGKSLIEFVLSDFFFGQKISGQIIYRMQTDKH